MSSEPDVAIQPARPDDLSELRSLAEECFLSVDFQAELGRNYAWLRVARSPGGVCGFLLAWRAADEVHLTDLGVTAPWRRKGVARRLVLELLTEARAAALRVVLLEARASNLPALSLYEGLGFLEVARRERYYADTDEDAVVMKLELG